MAVSELVRHDAQVRRPWTIALPALAAWVVPRVGSFGPPWLKLTLGLLAFFALIRALLTTFGRNIELRRHEAPTTATTERATRQIAGDQIGREPTLPLS
jgi:hypothetical protein